MGRGGVGGVGGGSHADHALLPICRTNGHHQSGRSPGRHCGGEHRAALSGVSWPHARAEVHLVLQWAAHPFWKPLGLFWESRWGEWSHDITNPSKKRQTRGQSSAKWGSLFPLCALSVIHIALWKVSHKTWNYNQPLMTWSDLWTMIESLFKANLSFS